MLFQYVRAIVIFDKKHREETEKLVGKESKKLTRLSNSFRFFKNLSLIIIFWLVKNCGKWI